MNSVLGLVSPYAIGTRTPASLHGTDKYAYWILDKSSMVRNFGEGSRNKCEVVKIVASFHTRSVI